MFRTIILSAALSLTAMPLLAQESWSDGQILTPYHEPYYEPQYETQYEPHYQPQYQPEGRTFHRAPAYNPDYGRVPAQQRQSIIHHPVYTGAQMIAGGPGTRIVPGQQRIGPVIRGYGDQAARSQVRGGVVQYRAAEPGGTAFESGPGTETTVIQRGPDGVAVTVIYNP